MVKSMLSSELASEISLGFDPGRVCFGLSRIGYTPASAICDILDNSVRAEASTIRVIIVKERQDLSDARKNNVKEYLVIDDGLGMNAEGMRNALKLGSSDENYENNSLSKFGLGLKSAAFSQGDELHLISSSEPNQFHKYVVSLPEIQQEKRYFAREFPLSEEDSQLVNEYLPEGVGTIVRIAKVRMVNHPSVKKTVEELQKKVGVIYYYFMRDDGLSIFVGDQSDQIQPFDVLFVNEADENGNLDENEWDAKTVRWIEKPKEIVLDASQNVRATVEVTNLPYPPIFDFEERGKSKAIRDKYMIGAGNYGYYVYRNKRLISWAESFDGIIPMDQDFYAFRGRILINESADDSFNIDVKKSTLTLSDEAHNEISDRSDEYKRKSKKSWIRGNHLKKEAEGADPNLTANEIVSDFEPLDSLPGEPMPTPETERERLKRTQEVEEEMHAKIQEEAIRQRSEAEGREINEEDLSDEDLESALKGDANPAAEKIYKVAVVEDNALWEPYYDTDRGGCVRINKFHRFAKLIFEDNSTNVDLQVTFQLLLLQMSEAEVYAQKSLENYERKDVKHIVAEYRRIISEYLAAMCRSLEGKLPPLEK